MQSIQRVTLLAVLGLALSAPQSVQAAPSGGPTTSNVEDLYYDFEVWQAEYEIIYVVSYGSSVQPTKRAYFATIEEAEQFMDELLVKHPGLDAHIWQLPLFGAWEYITTFDKRADAEQAAQAATGPGVLAVVERVKAFPRLNSTLQQRRNAR